MSLKNIQIVDDNDILSKKNSRELLYHGNPNIIKPTNKELQSKKRVRPLAAAILGLDNTSIPLVKNHDTINYWTDHDALESYLQTKPTCYLILGQHGGGNFSLGEAFSKKKNTIHLCPKNIILDEIEQNSITGRCIDFNLRHNKVCKFDTIFAMLQQKLQSSTIKHRGFVISGLPLIDNGLDMKHIIDNLFSEEAYSIVETIIQDVLYFKKHPKLKSVSSNSPATTDIELSEEELEEEDEIDNENDREIESLDLSKFLLNPCNNIISLSGKIYEAKKSVLLRQAKDLFGFNPDVIINISYPFNDLARKRIRRYYNYATDSLENDHIVTYGNDSEIRWPTSCILYENNKQIIDSRTFNPKYNCRHPIHFEEKTYKQICNYKQHVNDYVEMKLKEFHPLKIVNLDGRISLHEKLRNIQERMSLMPINPVIIPEPLYLDEPPEDYDDFWKTVQELNVIRNGTMNFNRYHSPWYNRCPVELQQRRSVQGKTKYSVTFFKYVFIISSLNAMSLFCKNPRPYLKLNYLEPTCRTIIIGTKSSGKSMIAKCLSWIFDAPIICYTQLKKEKEEEKYKKISENILSEIIAIIEDKRLGEWERLELERKSKLNTWFNKMSSTLHTYVSLLKKTSDTFSENKLNESVSNKYSNFINELSFLPMLNDLKSCENVLQNHNLLKYAPSDLTTEISQPSTPALGDEDVSQEICEYIAANNLQNDLLPTTEEIMSEIIDIIKSFDLKAHHNNYNIYGKFIIDGFPSNPDFWEHLIKSNLLPDYTISVFENREIDSELLQHYVAIETSVKSYYERILLSTDVLIKTKLLHETPIDTITSYTQLLIDGILQIALSTIFQENDNEKNDTDKIKSFVEEVDSFRENWELLKLKLEENNKSFVEIEIGNHSDIEVLDEVLLKLRKCYCRPCFKYEGEIFDSDEDRGSDDILLENGSRNLGETKVYCPICFYDHGVLWLGREEISLKFDNRLYYFNNDECSESFQNDVTKYQKYNLPLKKIPSIRICIVGCIGSGKSEVSKKIAKELGLLYVDFDYFLNTFLLPRHFKKVGWRYENSFIDTIFDGDRDIEFQIDEEDLNMDNEKLSNEQDFRRILHNYFERGSPIPTTWIRKILHKLWNEPPFVNTGVVIDGFPKSVTDVENMSACFCIPDLVIELEGSYDTTLERLSPHFTHNWKKQMHEAKLKAEIKLNKEKQEWMQFITTKVIVKLIFDNILDNSLIGVEEPNKQQSTESPIIDAHPSGSINVDPNLFTTYNELIQKYPEPVDRNEWESIDEALEKIYARWERIFEVDEGNIRVMKDSLIEQNINFVSVDANKSAEYVFRTILLKLTFIRNRCDSFFEQTFVVSCDVAEMLLLEGFFLLSKFYRLCPVHAYENPSLILHTFNMSKNQGRLFPIIHRTYIYFITSKENVIKFRKNPLKYIGTNIFKTYQHYPIRIAIVGPPKSGKSKLTFKLAKRYGLLCVSKGMAIRYILREMRWTDLGFAIEETLRAGKCIDPELIIKAVLTLLIDSRATVNGYILDGFPETSYEASALLKYGIYPFIIFYVNSREQTIKGNSQREVYYDIIKERPPYSNTIIMGRYTNWLSRFNLMRDWIENDTRNMYVIDGNNSQWQCHSDALHIVETILQKIHYYLHNVDNRVVSVGMLGISNECFEKQMSCFKNFCPLCLHKNILRHSGYPPNKSGLVQYKDRYYWICGDHLELVLHDSKSLTYLKDIKIPEIPIVIQNINMSLIYEDGICLVTYAENLPSQKIINGKTEYAAMYNGRVYLFCSSECLEKFLATPHMYYDVTIFKEFQTLPKLSLKSLPNLGYLEQTIGNIITEACCAVNVIRPKYPGLNISLSGLLYVALYLKTFNPLEDKTMVQIYKRKLRSFESRSKLITTIGSRLRSMRNPFTIYPQCCYHHDVARKIASSSSSSFASSYLSFHEHNLTKK